MLQIIIKYTAPIWCNLIIWFVLIWLFYMYNKCFCKILKCIGIFILLSILIIGVYIVGMMCCHELNLLGW